MHTINVTLAWLAVLACLYVGTVFFFLVYAVIMWFYRARPLKNWIVSRIIMEHFGVAESWAKHSGFQYLGLFGNAFDHLALWEHAEQATIFSLTLDRPDASFRFFTINDTIGLETSSQRADIMLPSPPGHYIQVFPKDSPAVLWRKGSKHAVLHVEVGQIFFILVARKKS